MCVCGERGASKEDFLKNLRLPGLFFVFFFNAKGKPVERKRLKMRELDYVSNRTKF